MQENSSFFPLAALHKLQKLNNNGSLAQHSFNPQPVAQKPFRETLKDQWKQECLKKRRSLMNFLFLSQQSRTFQVPVAEIKEQYKLPNLLTPNWPGDEEIVSIFNQNMSRNFLTKANMKNWSNEEIAVLIWLIFRICAFKRKAISVLDESDYEILSGMIPGKSCEDCKFKWLSLKKVPLNQTPWTSAEDLALTQIIQRTSGNFNWKTIAQNLHTLIPSSAFRAGKQCRERWNNYLNPQIKRGNWTCQEDLCLVQSVQDHGKKWASISKRIPGRNENAVKNRYNSLIKRHSRLLQQNAQFPFENLPSETREKYLIQMLIAGIKKESSEYENSYATLTNDEENESSCGGNTYDALSAAKTALNIPISQEQDIFNEIQNYFPTNHNAPEQAMKDAEQYDDDYISLNLEDAHDEKNAAEAFKKRGPIENNFMSFQIKQYDEKTIQQSRNQGNNLQLVLLDQFNKVIYLCGGRERDDSPSSSSMPFLLQNQDQDPFV